MPLVTTITDLGVQLSARKALLVKAPDSPPLPAIVAEVIACITTLVSAKCQRRDETPESSRREDCTDGHSIHFVCRTGFAREKYYTATI